MQKINKYAIINYDKTDENLVDILSQYLIENAKEIYDFFDVDVEKANISIIPTKEEFDRLIKEKKSDSNYVVPKYCRGCRFDDGEILILSIYDYKNTTHAFKEENYEQALDEYKKVFVHEYIHYVNYLFENKHNCSRTARYLVDGIASYLSHQYDNLDADFDYSIEDILGNNCYFGWYLVTKYLIENYTHDYILELFQSSRQARELLINELYDEVKNNRKCDKK